MRRFIRSNVKWFVLLFLFLFNGCEINKRNDRITDSDGTRDLQHIIEEGLLVAVTDFNSTNYFIHRGEPMGFQFDMLQAFASHIDVKLEIIAENDLDEAFSMLDRGEVDVFANNLTITSARNEKYSFTIPHSTTRQVLVQRKNKDSDPIRKPLELADKIVYVQKGSASAHRLNNLSEEIGAEIIVVEMADYEADELIELVAQGEIDYTVCDEDVAKVNAFYYEILDVETPVSFEQNLAWAVDHGSPNLLTEINEWLKEFKKTAEYSIIKRKYYNNPYWARRVLSENYNIRMGKISPFDDRFKDASSSIDWDWRLFASLVYQESRFRHNVQSHMGAYGLMQFMPATADYFGIKHKTDASTQIKAGARYLRWLEKRFEDSIPDPEQRLKFILASYNAGIGHVIDAQNLARKHGKDPHVWDNNVDFFILNKNNPDYYCDTTVRFGYLRGTETYNYVVQIMQRYQHYQNIVPD